MLASVAGWRVSAGWTASRTAGSGASSRRRAAAASSEDALRTVVRVAQVMTGPRARMRPLGAAKPGKLAFARRHMLRAEAPGRRIAVRPAMDEHLDTRIGPVPEAALEGAVPGDRGVVPMVGHDEHRESPRARPFFDQSGEP